MGENHHKKQVRIFELSFRCAGSLRRPCSLSRYADENIKLQCQLQFLEKRVPESRPNNKSTKTNIKDPGKCPITIKPADNNKISERKE